ncbi:MAG: YdcF family protein [Hyphomicrobiales bacterium]|nr:YdcF family protein [Hyphomicrobiales bacterium]
MLLSLEQQYGKPSPQTIGSPSGVIVLGGMIDTATSEARANMTLNNAAERLTEAARLAYRFPEARIVMSGGASTVYRGKDEASSAKQFLTDLGVADSRVLTETNSKNTWQNAIYSKEIIQPQPGERWLLITSAFHMPRSVGVFRAAGFEVIPWPVDYRTRGDQDAWRLPTQPSEAWRNIDLATKEWIGYAVYALTGRLK